MRKQQYWEVKLIHIFERVEIVKAQSRNEAKKLAEPYNDPNCTKITITANVASEYLIRSNGLTPIEGD